MSLHSAISEANNRERIGLILYVIPNFPDPKTYLSVLRYLETLPYVSIVENTFPVTEGFSEHANEFIRSAHLQASKFKLERENIRGKKPALCVLYKGTTKNLDFESFLEANKDCFEGLILEWAESDESPYVKKSNARNIELVQCIGPWMTSEEMKRRADNCVSSPLVYLMSADGTGADLFSSIDIENCARRFREFKPNAKIAAGFGIKTSSDVAKIGKMKGVDAAIIGTQFLKVMSKGLAETKAYLSGIEKELHVA